MYCKKEGILDRIVYFHPRSFVLRGLYLSDY